MAPERIEIVCSDIVLEGVLAFPEGKGPFGLVVVCHPHPLYGGSMDNNVVDAVCRGVARHNLAWLKFNFRGVGQSGGSYAGGSGECDDLKAALLFAGSKEKIDPRRIGICGYSFGSRIAFAVAAEEQVKAVAGISPFLQPACLSGFLFPKFFMCGTDDDFINAENLKKLVGMLPEPRELILCPGVDHFWWGHEHRIEEKVGNFFARCV